MQWLNIIYEAILEINSTLLRQVLKDLIEENLVEERTVGEGTIVYAVTPRARTVRGRYRELAQFLPITEELTRE